MSIVDIFNPHIEQQIVTKENKIRRIQDKCHARFAFENWKHWIKDDSDFVEILYKKKYFQQLFKFSFVKKDL